MGKKDNLNSELLRRFTALQAAALEAGHVIDIGSGYRTIQEQIDLRRTNGCKDIWNSRASDCKTPTAIPGQSNHNHGLAIDFSGNSAADEWVAANAASFGLHLPVNGENWHLEMMEDDDSRQAMLDARAQGGIGFDVEMMDADSEEDVLANRLHSILRILGLGQTDKTGGMELVEQPQDSVSIGVQNQQAIRPRSTRRTTPRGEHSGATNRDAYIEYAKGKLQQYGWDESELGSLIELWDRESNWNPKAQNPTSTAYGIAQFLNGTWGGTGYEKSDDPYTQIDAGLEYINGRFKSPSRALQFHDQNNWY